MHVASIGCQGHAPVYGPRRRILVVRAESRRHGYTLGMGGLYYRLHYTSWQRVSLEGWNGEGLRDRFNPQALLSTDMAKSAVHIVRYFVRRGQAEPWVL